MRPTRRGAAGVASASWLSQGSAQHHALPPWLPLFLLRGGRRALRSTPAVGAHDVGDAVGARVRVFVGVCACVRACVYTYSKGGFVLSLVNAFQPGTTRAPLETPRAGHERRAPPPHARVPVPARADVPT